MDEGEGEGWDWDEEEDFGSFDQVLQFEPGLPDDPERLIVYDAKLSHRNHSNKMQSTTIQTKAYR